MSDNEDPADILNDALEFLGGTKVVGDEVIKYGDLHLTVAAKVTSIGLKRFEFLSDVYARRERYLFSC
jgi:hypothetical protein